jgi:hypothetical protein
VSIHRAPDVTGAAPVAPRHRSPGIPYVSGPVAWAAAFVTLVAFAIYLRTLMPATGFWDTGEAQTVPHTLSIFHPTGFPTYAVLGWLWSQLPIGEVAYRMNLLSAVCVALAAGLTVLITAQLLEERNRWVTAVAAAVAGATFAFASEAWENALRADVHALHIFIAALIVWLLVTWRSAEWAGAPHAGRWLAVAALMFGLGLGNHPLTGLMAFAIGPWLFIVDPGIWRRWRLLIACAALLLLGLLVYLYIPIRAHIWPEPPLFYARPTTWEGFRYLVFAEQFHGLFDQFGSPLQYIDAKWAKAESVLAAQLVGPGWLVVAMGAASLAVRRLGAFAFLVLLMASNVFYAMNFQDGDIDRYYLLSTLVACVFVGVAVGTLAAAGSRAIAEATRRTLDIAGRRAAARIAGTTVLVLGALLPVVALVTRYDVRDQSANHEADRWVTSVYRALPQDAVIISWWSYSTPLWYHRWVLGDRPDITIIDERNILDDGWSTIDAAIRAYLGRRPVYLVPPDWEAARLLAVFRTRPVETYGGYTDIVEVLP